MTKDLTVDLSTLVQEMGQCWPRCVSPYGVTRPQLMHTMQPSDDIFWGVVPCIGLLHRGHKALSNPIPTFCQLVPQDKYRPRNSRYHVRELNDLPTELCLRQQTACSKNKPLILYKTFMSTATISRSVRRKDIQATPSRQQVFLILSQIMWVSKASTLVM